MVAFACLAFALVAPALALPRPRDAIVGGEEAVPHSIPWQVSLRRKSDDFHFCGGSVLSANSIVTAAHCTEIWDSPGEVQILAGGHNNAKPDGLEQRRDVAKLTVHEDYASLKNDIAIWELTEPLLLDERVQPVPMPTMMQESTGNCNVSGWGTLHSGGQTPDQLMVVSVPIVAEARCQLEYPFQIAKSMICAGEYGKDSCQGDSGGPMVCYNADGSGYLGGIVSWGIGCGGLYHPGVYTEVSYFVDWVEAHTPALPTDPPTTMPPKTTMPATTMPPTTMPATTMPPTTMPATTMPATTMPATTMPPTTMPATTMPRTTMPPTEPTTAMPGTTM
jgi:secreted trypsin-like serine protease